MKLAYGSTRVAFLTKKYAIKVPAWHRGWYDFLRGLLANMQETSNFSWAQNCNDPVFCPIAFSCWGGWFIVMMRADPLTKEQWQKNVVDAGFFDNMDPCFRGFVENKIESLGFYRGNIVAIDYGSECWAGGTDEDE